MAISSYVCRSMYPTLNQVIQYLNRPQLEELYRYYVGSVRPCLLLAGVPALTPPTRLAFVLSASGDLEWNPFQQV
ncbi:hypothetical protein [Glaciihabitans sp. UYNi722]|uniref:hypothetical protein n=1 Tax=Glaciihabitans sp. UYNi722 TaxID=3156344 RepID=UPI00339ACC95